MSHYVYLPVVQAMLGLCFQQWFLCFILFYFILWFIPPEIFTKHIISCVLINVFSDALMNVYVSSWIVVLALTSFWSPFIHSVCSLRVLDMGETVDTL